MNTNFDYPELTREKALNKIVKLFEAGYYVSHTNIAKEFGITQIKMLKMLKNQPNNLFAEIKAQNKLITLKKLQVRGVTRHLEKKRNEIETDPEVLFTENNLLALKQLRKKAKVVVRLPNENDLDFKLFKSKAVGGGFPKDYKGSFSEYVCGVGRKQISY